MMMVGLQDGGFVCPELSKLSPGFSREFLLGLVNFRRGSINDAVIRYSPDVVLYYVGVYSLLVPSLVC